MSLINGIFVGADSNSYQIESGNSVKLVKSRKNKLGLVPASVMEAGIEYLVKGIGPDAFKDSDAIQIRVSARLLREDAIRNCLRGSRVESLLINTGIPKLDKTLRKKYKEIFREEISGRKVRLTI